MSKKPVLTQPKKTEETIESVKKQRDEAQVQCQQLYNELNQLKLRMLGLEGALADERNICLTVRTKVAELHTTCEFLQNEKAQFKKQQVEAARAKAQAEAQKSTKVDNVKKRTVAKAKPKAIAKPRAVEPNAQEDSAEGIAA